MNREELMQMKAGPELDALIAEKNMGFTWQVAYYSFTQSGKDIKKGENYLQSPNGYVYIPAYSTNDSAALLVAKTFDHFQIEKLSNDYWVFLGREKKYAIMHKSLAMAICLAAYWLFVNGEIKS